MPLQLAELSDRPVNPFAKPSNVEGHLRHFVGRQAVLAFRYFENRSLPHSRHT
jgi:hypothetical protein